MSNKIKPKEVLGLLTVLAIVVGVGWLFMWYDNKHDKQECVGQYRTVNCLQRLVDEATAKEEYENKLKELRNRETTQ